MFGLSLQLIVALVGAGVAKVAIDHFFPRLNEVVKWAIYLSIVAVFVVAQYLYALRQGAPRRLSHDQQQKLTASLNKAPDSFCCGFAVAYFRSCNDCPDYAWDFAISLNDIRRTPRYRIAPIPLDVGIVTRNRGVFVAMLDADHPSMSAKSIVAALEAAQIKFKRGSFPEMHENVDPAADTILLIMPRD